MESVLVLADPLEERAQLSGALALRPFGEPRDEMEPENAAVDSVERQLEERVSRVARLVPLRVGHGNAGQETHGVFRSRSPVRHRGLGRHFLDHARIRRLLEQHDVGVHVTDHLRDRLCSPAAAEPDVVGEETQHQSSAFASSLCTITKYGWLMTLSRRNCTRSAVAWMLTGRPAMRQSALRSGTNVADASGCASLNGAVCKPGM